MLMDRYLPHRAVSFPFKEIQLEFRDTTKSENQRIYTHVRPARPSAGSPLRHLVLVIR